MKFLFENSYHIYNRGNNKNNIFFNSENYFYFIYKIRKHLLPHCSILAYCLMPNHFHFLIFVDRNIGGTDSNRATDHPISKGLRILLSSYSQAINIQQKRTGNLFQQNTKIKCISDILCDNISNNYYDYICFNYIHQNPLKAKLVQRIEDWEFSSFRDYIGLRKGTLCNLNLAFNIITNLEKENLYKMSYESLTEEDVNKIF
ncbi:MAG: transposase [Ignavibacteria bacterium]|nr:transposase [Bacteroidota bacterium]MBL7129082.1 transposase [Ignavibacteria bacterium]